MLNRRPHSPLTPIPKKQYRIVRDCYRGYEVQAWRWWFPFWFQVRINTHATVEEARAYAKKDATYVVEKIGEIKND